MGVKLHCRRKCLGMCNAVAKVFPEATPKKHMSEVSRILEAIHAQENKEAARKKVRDIVEKLCSMRLNEATKKVEDGIEETLTYMDFSSQDWLKICTNNVIERINREIRRRARRHFVLFLYLFFK